jgi:hypothetical protein
MIAQTEASLREGFAARRQPGGFVDAPRIHTAITARAERWLLTWIVERMPAGIHPDHLTALGFLSQLLAGAAYALASYNAHLPLGVCSKAGWRPPATTVFHFPQMRTCSPMCVHIYMLCAETC